MSFFEHWYFYLAKLDIKLFTYLNLLRSDSFDFWMNFWSNSLIPVIGVLIFIIWGLKKFHHKKWIRLFFLLIFCVGISDGISSHILKPNVARYRPCHSPLIGSMTQITEPYCGGGKFGFVSSHASNSFAFATFAFYSFKNFIPGIRIIYALPVIISYSRIYLGKHYPADLFFGGLLGFIICFILIKIFKVNTSYKKKMFF